MAEMTETKRCMLRMGDIHDKEQRAYFGAFPMRWYIWPTDGTVHASPCTVTVPMPKSGASVAQIHELQRRHVNLELAFAEYRLETERRIEVLEKAMDEALAGVSSIQGEVRELREWTMTDPTIAKVREVLGQINVSEERDA